jgi:hypothetical protein
MTEQELEVWDKIQTLIRDYGRQFRCVAQCEQIIGHVEDGLDPTA